MLNMGDVVSNSLAGPRSLNLCAASEQVAPMPQRAGMPQQARRSRR